jgi:hypothetical protein
MKIANIIVKKTTNIFGVNVEKKSTNYQGPSKEYNKAAPD